MEKQIFFQILRANFRAFICRLFKSYNAYLLTHQGRITRICAGKLTQLVHLWLFAWSKPSHYLIQYRYIVNSNLSNKFQWNIKPNLCIFFQENAFENVVCEMVAIFTRPQFVKTFHINFLFSPLVCHSSLLRTLPCIIKHVHVTFASIVIWYCLSLYHTFFNIFSIWDYLDNISFRKMQSYLNVIIHSRVQPWQCFLNWRFANFRYDCNKQLPCNSWWRHQIETFSELLALCVGNSPVTGIRKWCDLVVGKDKRSRFGNIILSNKLMSLAWLWFVVNPCIVCAIWLMSGIANDISKDRSIVESTLHLLK